MPNHADITAAIKAATGDPASGPIHEWTPIIANAIDELVNPTKPETKTKTKNDYETRIIDNATHDHR